MAARIVLILVATFMIWYFVKPQFESRDSATSNQVPCPCDCDCDEDFSLSLPLGLILTLRLMVALIPLILFLLTLYFAYSFSVCFKFLRWILLLLLVSGFCVLFRCRTTSNCQSGTINSSYTDCGNSDPEIHEEMGKNIVALLSEEIALQIRVANETLEHSKELVIDARRASMHYQREAEKCNAQTETCEAARERAEAELREEFKITAMWAERARELGWEDKM